MASIAQGMQSLSPRASFWVAAAVVCATLWASAAPSVTYPLYATQWNLTPTVTTAIFAVYPIVVATVLVLFGNISDYIGRRTTILHGLAAASIGAFLFAIAPSIQWVFAGRAFMGLGVGLLTSPATAAMVEFGAAFHSKRASSIATAATAVGLASALLLGGALIQYAPFPTHLNFWVLLAFLLALFTAAWFLPHTARNLSASRWRPGKFGIPPGLGGTFATSATAVTAAYAYGALFLSLGAQIARDLIQSSNTLVNGAAIALMPVVSAVVAILARGLPARTSIVAGGIASATGMGLLMGSAANHALPLFLAAGVFAGTAYSLLFLGGLSLINAHAPANHRAGTLSTIYLIAFVTMGTSALLLGLSATSWGLDVAVNIGAPAIGMLGIAAVALALRD